MRMRDLNKIAKRKAKEMIAEVHDFTWNGEDNKSYKNAKKACLITISHVLEATKAEREGIVIRNRDKSISFKAISNKFLLKEK